MGSASTHALAEARRALGDSEASSAVGVDLFRAARLLGESPQLSAAVLGGSADPAERVSLMERVFADRVGALSVAVLAVVANQRWSRESDAVAALEELGIRALASCAPSGVHLDRELLAFGAIVASDHELELALGSKLAGAEATRSLVTALLSGRSWAGTCAIVEQLALAPRGRSLRSALARAAELVADEDGFAIATVTGAEPLDEAQTVRLASELSERYGRSIRVHQVTDARVLGGLRIQVGAEVIDGTIATRLTEARLQFA